MAVTLETSARNAACNGIVDLIDAGSGAGTLEFQTSGGTEVATLTFTDPAFGNATTGTATAAAIASDTDAAGGTTTKAVAKDSDGTAVFTCSVTASGGGGDITLAGGTTIGASATVAVSSLTVTVPAS